MRPALTEKRMKELQEQEARLIPLQKAYIEYLVDTSEDGHVFNIEQFVMVVGGMYLMEELVEFLMFHGVHAEAIDEFKEWYKTEYPVGT